MRFIVRLLNLMVLHDDISPFPFKSKGTEYTCNCDWTGYTGPLCEDDEDECIKIPSQCDSSGTEKCENNVGGYECTCKNGYLGKTCDAIESLCMSMPNICLYGGKSLFSDMSLVCHTLTAPTNPLLFKIHIILIRSLPAWL